MFPIIYHSHSNTPHPHAVAIDIYPDRCWIYALRPHIHIMCTIHIRSDCASCTLRNLSGRIYKCYTHIFSNPARRECATMMLIHIHIFLANGCVVTIFFLCVEQSFNNVFFQFTNPLAAIIDL